MSVSGRASPLCSDRNSFIDPRSMVTNAGNPGSNRWTDVCWKPSRWYHATAISASCTRSIGITFSSILVSIVTATHSSCICQGEVQRGTPARDSEHTKEKNTGTNPHDTHCRKPHIDCGEQEDWTGNVTMQSAAPRRVDKAAIGRR
jgi:hypothetical protein